MASFREMRSILLQSFEGRRHNSAMLADSGLLDELEQHAFSTTREPMALHGDPAYPLRVYLQVPYRGAEINTTNGATQQSHEFRSHVCRVAFRGHCKLLDY